MTNSGSDGTGRRLRVLLVGVGGQGVLTAAHVLGNAAAAAGLDVSVGQLHGMSQRGGSVEATVLIGRGTSAFVDEGEADIVLGFEALETLRARPRMNCGTHVLINTSQIAPFALAREGQDYPDLDAIIGSVREACADVLVVDGPALIAGAGQARALNIVLLGALAGTGLLPLDQATLRQAIEQRYAPKYRVANQQAYALGCGAAAAPAATERPPTGIPRPQAGPHEGDGHAR